MLTGAALAYFLDPRAGKRRRTVPRDWTAARIRNARRGVRRRARYASSRTLGKWHRLEHAFDAPKPQPDDVTLAHKVESIIFRDPHVPKGQMSVNAEEGVVYLRGEVPEQSMMNELVRQTKKIDGVVEVENLLHLPGQQAPTHT